MYCNEAVGEGRIDMILFCSSDPSCDKINLVRSAGGLRRELDVERCQLGNVEKLKLLE